MRRLKDQLTIGLSKEVAAEGIRVNCIRPGFIEAGIHERGGGKARIARIAPSLPMQRGGTAEEIANAAFCLLSDEASYCSGSFIDMAGGL